MPSYKAPVDEALFLLNEVLKIDKRDDVPGYPDFSPDLIEATLNEAGRLCEEVIAPLNLTGDAEGCKLNADGSVTTPKGFKDAFRQLCDGGWMGISSPEEFGGQAFPVAVSSFVAEYLCSANLAFWMYTGLTQGAIDAFLDHASAEQQAAYLPKMVAGEWTGVMNLTEPHCGTDLGLLRTKAAPQADGSYKITGTKIFISAGDHDMAENIIHLVLARIEGAPSGVKGISLFVVPKVLVDANGALGARNTVSVGSLEHKMGIHGNCTCVMNFDDATGWLVGGENRGLNAMFTMMNHARLGVGIHGLGISEVAYQNAAVYAKERLQSRAPTGPAFPDKPADPLIVHPDVRRMLMTIRAKTQAFRALSAYAGVQKDISVRSQDPDAREAAEDLVGLLTPILKAIGSDDGFQNAVLAQQVFGGHGYIVENGMEQFVRDARINQIYEGANGIQALDLAGRKLSMNGGRAYRAFVAEMETYLTPLQTTFLMGAFAAPVLQALAQLNEATTWLAKNGSDDRNTVGAAAYDYMELFGLVAFGYMWCRMAQTAQGALTGPDQGRQDFYRAKLSTARFFMAQLLPQTACYLERIKSGPVTVMELAADAF